jgi:hypothetical protein
MTPCTLPRGLPPLHAPKDVILRPTRFETLVYASEVRRIPLPRTRNKSLNLLWRVSENAAMAKFAEHLLQALGWIEA